MRGKLDWAGNRECDWSFLSHEVTYFKGLGITKEDLVDEGVPVISYGQIHSKTNDGMHLRRDLLRYIPRTLTEGNENSRLRRGDIVFADTSEDVDGAGNCILVDTDDEVYAGYHTLVARPKNSNCGAYLARLFQSAAWRSQIQSRICGIKVFSITRKILKGVSVLTPPEESQRRIVDYLDGRTAAIDARVAVLEKKLAAYKRLKASVINRAVTRGLDPKAKLKDSGVDWIGKVPVGWRVARVKTVANVFRGGSPRPIDDYISHDDTGLNWIKIGDADKGSKYITHVAQKIRVEGLSKTRQVHVGDLLLSNSMSFGEAYILKVDGCIHDGWVCISCGKDIDKEFLYYFFRSQLALRQFDLLANGGVVQNLNIEKIAGVGITAPPLAEQRAIADYLDAECAKIDKMAELVTREIELYKKLKRSLINEVVTGKREVA